MKPNTPSVRKLALNAKSLRADTLAIFLAMLAGQSAHAATYYWDTTATTSSWNYGASWSNNSTSGGTTGVVPLSTDSVVFNQSSLNGQDVVQLNGTTTIAGITFNNTGTTLIDSDTLGTARTLVIGSGGITVSSAAGAVSIGHTTNTANIALGASQTWTNNSAASTLGAANGVTSAGTSGTQTLSLAGIGNVTFSGVIGNGATGGTLALTQIGTGTTTLTAANTYTGDTTIKAGTLVANIAGSLGTSAITLGDTAGTSNATLYATNSTFSNAINVAAGSTGILTLGGNYAYSTTYFSGPITLNNNLTVAGANSNAKTALSGAITSGTAGTQTLTLKPVGAVAISGTISGALNLVQAGSGTSTLSSVSNAYTGTTTIKAGTLVASAAGSLGTSAIILGDTAGTSSASLYATNSTFTNAITVAAGSTGTLTLGGNFSGSTTNFNGTITLNNNLTVAGYGGGKTAFAGLITSGTAGTQTLTFASGTNVSVSGTIGGALNLNIAQTGGVATLTYANTYTGTTTVTSGTLAVANNLSVPFANSPTITVGTDGSSNTMLDVTQKFGSFHLFSGQTGKGIGNWNVGAGYVMTVDAGAHWAPGNAVGTNSVTGNLALLGAADFQLGTANASRSAAITGTNNDRTAVSGTLALGGALNLSDNAGANSNGSVGAGSYLLFTAGTVTGSFNSVNNVTGYHAKVDTSTAGSVYVDNYQIAAASTLPTSVNLGITHVGKSFTSSTLSIQNTATSNGYAEKLGATVTGTTSAATATGSVTGLAGGSTSQGITVGLSDTTVGAKTGTVTVGFTSDGSTNSGYSSSAAGSQSVTVNGQVNYYAAQDFALSSGDGTLIGSGTSYTLSLGTYDWHAGSKTFTTTLTLTNTLSDAIYQDVLNGKLTLSVADGFVLTSASTVSLASGSSTALTLTFDTTGITSSGVYSGLLTLDGTSVNTSESASLNSVNVALELQVVPEPSTWAMIVGGVGMMVFVQRARSRVSC
jgi:autotransporter-associated beta strand protein